MSNITRIFAVIKPNKHNKYVMKKRGLFSDDGYWIFDLYESIYNSEKYTIDDNKENAYRFEELEKMGIKL